MDFLRQSPAIINGTALRNIRDVEPETKQELFDLTAAGTIDPVTFGTVFVDSEIPFETVDLETLLGSIALDVRNGLKCTNGAKFQYRKQEDGSFTAGSNHVVLNSPLGYAFLQEITADQDSKQPAIAKCLYHPLYSGGVYCAIQTGQALTSTPAVPSFFKLGPLYFDGTQFAGAKRVRMTTGTKYETERADGQTYAEAGKVTDRGLSFEYDLQNITGLAAAGIVWDQSVKLTTPTHMYLRKNIDGGIAYGDAETEHIKITFTTATATLQKISKGSKADAIATLKIMLNDGGTTGQLLVATGSAIP